MSLVKTAISDISVLKKSAGLATTNKLLRASSPLERFGAGASKIQPKGGFGSRTFGRADGIRAIRAGNWGAPKFIEEVRHGMSPASRLRGKVGKRVKLSPDVRPVRKPLLPA